MQTEALSTAMRMRLQEENAVQKVQAMTEKQKEELQSMLDQNANFQEINCLLERHQKEMDKLVVSLIENSRFKA
jgi:DNA-binding PadR family transcriptional regulator